MREIWQFALGAVAAVLLGGAAPAPDGGMVCVGGPMWRPTIEETRAIAETPVPPSFEKTLEAPCAERTSNDDILVDWHTRFGTERSAAAALAHLEHVYGQTLPPSESYAAELKDAWAQAQPDLARAREVKQPQGANYSAQWMFIESSKTITRLRALASTRDAFQQLAVLHQRAAERFSSYRLLEKTEHYLAPVVASATFLAPLDRANAPSNLLYYNLQTFRSDDLRMRAAVLRAELTRSARDIAAAEALLASLDNPLYRPIAEQAYGGGEDFCDIGRGAPGNAEAIEAACNRDEMRERVVAYWLNRAALDSIVDPPAGRDRTAREIALRLLERERTSDSRRCCYRSGSEDLFRLHMLVAADEARKIASSVDGRNHWGEALRQLREAEQLAPAVTDPTGFKQATSRWLALWELRRQLFRGEEYNGRLPDTPQDRRYAAYLRNTLEALDSIVAGDETPSPQRDVRPGQ